MVGWACSTINAAGLVGTLLTRLGGLTYSATNWDGKLRILLLGQGSATIRSKWKCIACCENEGSTQTVTLIILGNSCLGGAQQPTIPGTAHNVLWPRREWHKYHSPHGLPTTGLKTVVIPPRRSRNPIWRLNSLSSPYIKGFHFVIMSSVNIHAFPRTGTVFSINGRPCGFYFVHFLLMFRFLSHSLPSCCFQPFHFWVWFPI